MCSKLIKMERKNFLATTLALLPLVAFPEINKKAFRTKKPFVVRSGDSRFGEHMRFKGVNLNDIVISKKDTDNALSVFAYTGYSKVGPSLHLHFNQDEIFYVSEGNYRFVVGEETMELNTGDTIFLPRNIPHTWIQLSDKGKLIYAVQPAGTLEEFFKEITELKKPPTSAEAQKFHLKHGMKLVGPPLTL